MESKLIFCCWYIQIFAISSLIMPQVMGPYLFLTSLLTLLVTLPKQRPNMKMIARMKKATERMEFLSSDSMIDL